MSNEAHQVKYSLVILDFHGTMTDHQLRLIRAIHHSGHEAFGKHFRKGVYQEALTRPSQSSGVGVTNKEFFRRRFARHFSKPQVSSFLGRFDHYMNNTYIPIPGVIQTAKRLCDLGIDIVILTNGSNREVIQQALQKWGLGEISNPLYSSHITGVRKPDEETVNRIFRDFNDKGIKVPKEKVLMVGDYRDDIETAHNVGVDSVLIVRGNGQELFELHAPKPTYVITDPKELIPIVEGSVEPEIRREFIIGSPLWKKENWHASSKERR